jgi:hypothetical protein
VVSAWSRDGRAERRSAGRMSDGSGRLRDQDVERPLSVAGPPHRIVRQPMRIGGGVDAHADETSGAEPTPTLQNSRTDMTIADVTDQAQIQAAAEQAAGCQR